MKMFQTSVLKKYLNTQIDHKVEEAYTQFVAYFQDAKVQENIRNAKEEQFQEGFLRELFVNILGYTLNPTPNFNLTTELKNEKDAKKVDGAILKAGTVMAIIELKGTDTKDLDKVNAQAFNYKNNHAGCVYVITSNFEKLRLFIHNAVEYLEFNLFTLSRKEFKLLWLCLRAENLLGGLPEKIKQESLVIEEQITQKLYKDYSQFKEALWENACKNHPDLDRLLLFKKTQKLLDRFLFIFFAEDSGLLPPNSTRGMIARYQTLMELDAYKPLYAIFQQFFGYINTGKKGKTPEDTIFAYNGGLFLPDALLDSLKLDDIVLQPYLLKMSAYDFQSDVDVNILGHIFENSLSEIEAVTAQLQGEAIDKSKAKRKKDGVFYTPKYITQYIVENTVGKLCEAKKASLQIIDETYARKKRKKATTKKLLDTLQEYREWLLGLTLCDPACGSGAFLNQALEFLIQEHAYIDELRANLLGESLVFQDVSNQVLENNIYGVDINEESVEIAKLSLWLRTAQRGRKLSVLNHNIKCGNSLIDDPKIAGEKAFDWQAEFPQVFKKGGFDVVLGNPPYVRLQGIKANYEAESLYYEEKYKAATSNYDIYVLFLEKALALMHEKSVSSFILPHKFLISEFGKGIRGLLAEKKAAESLVHFGSEMVFADASTYTCILNLSLHNKVFKFKQLKPQKIAEPFTFEEIACEKLSAEKWNLNDPAIAKVLEKMNQQPLRVSEVFKKIFVGLQTSGDVVYLIKGSQTGDYVEGYSKALDKTVRLERGLLKPMLKGEDISRYKNLKNQYFVIFPYHLKEGKASPMSEDFVKDNFPLGYEYLKQNEAFLRGREKGRMNNEKWFLYIYPKSLAEFEQPKIITSYMGNFSNLSFDDGTYYHNTKCYSFCKSEDFHEDYLFYLSILNSSLFWFFIKNTSTVFRGGYYTFATKQVETFPLPRLEKLSDQAPFVEKAEAMLSLHASLQQEKETFLQTLAEEKGIKKASKKLQAFEELSYEGFKKELKKKKVSLALGEENNAWRTYFTETQDKVKALQQQITTTDAALNQMVYALYGLTEEEVAVVEKETA